MNKKLPSVNEDCPNKVITLGQSYFNSNVILSEYIIYQLNNMPIYEI